MMPREMLAEKANPLNIEVKRVEANEVLEASVIKVWIRERLNV